MFIQTEKLPIYSAVLSQCSGYELTKTTYKLAAEMRHPTSETNRANDALY